MRKTNTPQQASAVQASIDVSDIKTADNLTPVTIEITDNQGKPIEEFDDIKEVLMHLVIVSNDLQFFDPIHPTFVGQGRFKVNASFPFSGDYTLFSDYQPVGKPENLSVLTQTVRGSLAPEVSIDTTLRDTVISKTKVLLHVNKDKAGSKDASKVKAGEETTLQFELKQSGSDEPVKDLWPYLDAMGHLVIMKQSTQQPPTLDRDSYIHLHPSSTGTAGEVSFITRFPESGNYKLWGEFDRDGQKIVADFWMNVL